MLSDLVTSAIITVLYRLLPFQQPVSKKKNSKHSVVFRVGGMLPA